MPTREGNCQRCGRCCKSVYLSFEMSQEVTQKDKESAADFLRWAALHEGVRVNIRNEACAEVGYKAKCRMLTADSEGKAVCQIYDERPKICQEFPPGPNPTCPGFRFVENSDVDMAQKDKEIHNG